MNWLMLSVLSGLCAALNGLFAKLVTDAMSRGLANRVAARFPSEWGGSTAEWAIRGVGFLCQFSNFVGRIFFLIPKAQVGYQSELCKYTNPGNGG